MLSQLSYSPIRLSFSAPAAARGALALVMYVCVYIPCVKTLRFLPGQKKSRADVRRQEHI